MGLLLPNPLPHYRAGTLFLRISLDQIGDMATLEQLSSTGVLRSAEKSRLLFAGKACS
ncbi:MAG TPA: hypothetical protein VJ860_13955 [Polyangia bacterium]|nr:hypothetical protein [Polyangia bacterium]